MEWDEWDEWPKRGSVSLQKTQSKHCSRKFLACHVAVPGRPNCMWTRGSIWESEIDTQSTVGWDPQEIKEAATGFALMVSFLRGKVGVGPTSGLATYRWGLINMSGVWIDATRPNNFACVTWIRVTFVSALFNFLLFLGILTEAF